MELSGKRIVVAGLFSAKERRAGARLDGLAAGVTAAGGLVVGRFLQRHHVSRARHPGGSQRLDQPLSSLLFSPGKAEELAALCRQEAADLVVTHNRLSAGQRDKLAWLTGAEVRGAEEIVALGQR